LTVGGEGEFAFELRAANDGGVVYVHAGALAGFVELEPGDTTGVAFSMMDGSEGLGGAAQEIQEVAFDGAVVVLAAAAEAVLAGDPDDFVMAIVFHGHAVQLGSGLAPGVAGELGEVALLAVVEGGGHEVLF
jgi:hypothetical protein